MTAGDSAEESLGLKEFGAAARLSLLCWTEGKEGDGSRTWAQEVMVEGDHN
ncbi:hypothetical protein HPP92_008968 [Vanilla planifolia]|uniref:Uncharacterized protein n=1 Tax=Vanilla planifolia TaxID=51239 RepID=A0A835RID0_VANPL|nr:hypothetical protein HPP92_009169 [Vanilla planifolia]KAG0486873.1 hypothetical protein HPP92_008968 [Vanilla planifolia]